MLSVLPHAVFLQRVAYHPATAPEVRLGQGAFLTLRLLDLLADDREPVTPEAFRYQSAATERYCDDLAGEGAEAAHIHGLARIAAEARRRSDVRMIAPAMLAYGLYLEDEGHYGEASDVLESLLRIGGNLLATSDSVAALLRIGRVNRKMAAFDTAEARYSEASEIARAAGDNYSALLSRVGVASCALGRGNLQAAEQQYRQTLADAQLQGQRDVEARAEHGLAAVIGNRSQGQPDLAVEHLWRAYELYEDEPSRLRAMNDLGHAMIALGQLDAAQRALTVVVRRGGGMSDNLLNATLGLMNCASARRDRVGFERWRAEGEARFDLMPPNILADYYYSTGVGMARFGNFRTALALLDKAVAVAGENGIHELEFRMERVRDGLRDCEAEMLACETVAEPVIDTEAVREVSASLAALVA
jgi:tetratricopeptide (TPR) repeat protein